MIKKKNPKKMLGSNNFYDYFATTHDGWIMGMSFNPRAKGTLKYYISP